MEKLRNFVKQLKRKKQGMNLLKKIVISLLILTLGLQCVRIKIKIHLSNSQHMGPLMAAMIPAATAVLGGAINAGSQANMNKRNRKFQKEMYERQRADSIEFWNMQNTYNSPQAQMERFQAAGLNKNLIYGQGSSGNAGSIPTPDARTPDTRAPEWGSGLAAGGALGLQNYMDLQTRNITNDNLRLQADVITQEAQLKRAQIISTLANADKTKLSNEIERILKDTTVDYRRNQNKALEQQMELNTRSDARAAATTSSSLLEAMIRMNNMQKTGKLTDAQIRKNDQEIQNLKNSGALQRIDYELKKQEYATRAAGSHPNAPMYEKIIAAILTRWFNPDGTLRDDVPEKLNDWKSNFWEKLGENLY